MASLALLVSIIVLFTLLLGPITYLLAVLKFPKIIIYPLAALCFFVGINFCMIAIPTWYLGLIPIYCGYVSIVRVNKKETQG